MKILFDLLNAQPINGCVFHGGGEYIKSVFRRFVEMNKEICELSVFLNQDLFVDEWIKDLIRQNAIKTYCVKSNDDVQKVLCNNTFDVFFSGMPYSFGSIEIPRNTHYCGTIHGLRSIELPCDYYSFKYYSGLTKPIKAILKNLLKRWVVKRQKKHYLQCIQNMDSVVVVSEHTKYALKNLFPHLNKDICTFYTPQKYLMLNELEKNDVGGKYILMIACNRFEKNSYRALMALDGLFNKKLMDGYKVVLTGNLPEKIKGSIRNKNRFLQLGYVSSQKLESLYACCDFFLYPTLNEGFGMPPLEAMKYGKTCIVSGVCSLPEVCGDAVYYCNPYDINEIQNRILKASECKIERERIERQLRKIEQKQKDDVDGLCDYLVRLGCGSV